MSCREANLTLQGLGEGGGKCVLYQVGGCWTASRRETSGIDWRYSVGPKLLEHGGGGGTAAAGSSETSPQGSGSHCGFRRLSQQRKCYSRGRAREETQDSSADALEGREVEEEEEGWRRVG